MEKYIYIIIDLEDMGIVRWCESEQEARLFLYKVRKQRYIDENPNRPPWEYDTMKHDNGYNLYKVKLVA